MTAEEWEAICLHLDLAFAGEWDDDKADVYATFLTTYSVDEVMGALYVLAEGGQKFTPSVGEIMGVISDAYGPPPFERAWAAVEKAMMRYGAWREREVEMRSLAQLHPAVADWVDTYGWDRLAREEVKGEHGGAIMYRLSQSYAEHVADFRLRERAERRGLPGAPIRQLEEGT